MGQFRLAVSISCAHEIYLFPNNGLQGKSGAYSEALRETQALHRCMFCRTRTGLGRARQRARRC